MIRWKQYKYVYYCYDQPQLFDLSSDPGEDHDLIREQPRDPSVMLAAQECHKRLLSVCNPYEVDERAKQFQRKTKIMLGIAAYDTDMASCPVPHPEPVTALLSGTP